MATLPATYRPKLKPSALPKVPATSVAQEPVPAPAHETAEAVAAPTAVEVQPMQAQAQQIDDTTLPAAQGRLLTVEEALRYMNIKPSYRRFFQDKQGRYNAKLIEKYDWLWNGSRVVLIPKWFGDESCQQPFDATASCGA